MATEIHGPLVVERNDPSEEASVVLSDDDSGYDEDAQSTESVPLAIFQNEEVNGRTYHAFNRGKYVLPNDEPEQERMDMLYRAVQLVLGQKHFLSPIDHLGSVLDVGTGTGIWAIDVADEHAAAQVVGIDLSPIQPTDVPPNVQFQIADADEPWNFNQKFDLVHTRLMHGFAIRSWSDFYRQAFESLRPGGWVENQEFGADWKSDDNTLPDIGAVVEWQQLLKQGMPKLGMPEKCDPKEMIEEMERSGFCSVSLTCFQLPMGPWMKDAHLKEAGLLCREGMLSNLGGISAKVLTQGHGWSLEAREVLLMRVRDEWKNESIHSYMPINVLVGQKPHETGARQLAQQSRAGSPET